MQRVFPKPKRSRVYIALGAVLLTLSSAGLFYLIITGKIRKEEKVFVETPVSIDEPTLFYTPRTLDGVLVPRGQESLGIRAVMVENQIAARPLSGPAYANVAMEVPVEGGITRFLLLFDATTTVPEIGPVRSARPYFVEWAYAWRTGYFHVGGSPDALKKIRDLGLGLLNIDEMANADIYWRSKDRFAPHNAYTSSSLMTSAMTEKEIRRPPNAWHFQDMASSTSRGGVSSVRIPYGGSYNVQWKYDKERNIYTRWQGSVPQKDKDGTIVESENVIILKTSAQVLDKEGRLALRTVGSGEAMAYRDGNKYILQWRRSQNESIRFENNNGSEFLLNRGRTWIQVTTDDKVFAGLEK